MNEINEILNLFKEQKISYKIIYHSPVFTMDEMRNLHIDNINDVAKNLFLRDDKKKHYYLLVVREDCKVDLKRIRTYIQSRPLSFASETELKDKLGLTKGSVTPLGILNNSEHDVKIYIDKSFKDKCIGVHPNNNTATVFLAANQLKTWIEKQGSEAEYIEFIIE